MTENEKLSAVRPTEEKEQLLRDAPADGEEAAPQAAAAVAAAGPGEAGAAAEAAPAAAEQALPPEASATGQGEAPAARPPEADGLARLAALLAERLMPEDGVQREMEYLRLREELEEERRLRRMSENKLVCIRALEEAGVPVSFAELLVVEDGEAMQKRLSTFIGSVRAYVNREISMKLETLAPRIGGGDTGITKAQFRAMRIAEQQEIFNNNRPLYEELSR